MFGKKSHLGPLELRKQILIAESELNRAQLSEEWESMLHGARNLAHRAKSIASWISAAGLLLSGLSTFRENKPSFTEEKPSWIQRILKGAQLANSLWQAFHPGPGEVKR